MLRYTADRRTLFFVSLYFVVFAYAWTSISLPTLTALPWVAVPLILGLCVLAFLGAVTTHNAIHCPIFRYRWMNKIFQVVLTLTYGHPVSTYVPGHNLSHHKHTQSRRDVMRTTKARFRHNLLNLIFFVLLIAPSIQRADITYAKVTRKAHPRWFRQMLLELGTLWALQIALFVIDWRKALVFWLVPHLYAQWGIVTFNLLQHDGTDETTEYNHSRNFVGRFVNFWTYNNGFHTIHHMVPGLHWSLTPAAHAEKVAPYIHPNLDQRSLVGFIVSYFVMNQRRRYDGQPFILPEEGPDEDWVPDPRTIKEDLGAESMDSEHGGLLLGPAAPVHVPQAPPPR